MVFKFLNKETSKEHDVLRDTNWGPEEAMAMSKEVRDFLVPIGGGKLKTMGDLIDRTPTDLISKVVLEEKVFKTWYSGRTVLIGDGKGLSLLRTCSRRYLIPILTKGFLFFICYIMDGGVFLFSKLVIRYASEEKD